MSSISGISSSTSGYQSQFQQIEQAFTNLQTDLSSGNLSTAQQAYTTLTQDLKNVQQTQGGQQTGGNSQISTDLAAVGSALQSGSLSGAQSAFATLTQELQSSAQQTQTQGTQQTYGHHHHHHHGGGSSQAAGSSSQDGSTSLSSDLAAVGSALQSGSLSGAQSAFATLMQNLRNSTTGTSGNSSLLQTGSVINVSV
jgi:phage gp29-like protein